MLNSIIFVLYAIQQNSLLKVNFKGYLGCILKAVRIRLMICLFTLIVTNKEENLLFCII